MVQLIRRRERSPGQSRTVRFEGEPYGVDASFFLVDNDPGQGPGLHVHPYAETWIVHAGEVEFTVGTQTLRAGPGDIVVVEAGMPHGFRNVGEGRLEIFCMHPSGRVIQEFLS